MNLRPVIFYPDPVLKQKAARVEKFDAELGKLLDEMREIMYSSHGIGLAAPQIGVLQQVAVIDVSGEGKEYFEVINPTLQLSSQKVSSEEGCLSIPGFREKIKRSAKVTLKAFDRHGNEYTKEGEELLGFCMQHEVDHLNGILFTDHLSTIKKQIFIRWLKNEYRAEPESE